MSGFRIVGPSLRLQTRVVVLERHITKWVMLLALWSSSERKGDGNHVEERAERGRSSIHPRLSSKPRMLSLTLSPPPLRLRSNSSATLLAFVAAAVAADTCVEHKAHSERRAELNGGCDGGPIITSSLGCRRRLDVNEAANMV